MPSHYPVFVNVEGKRCLVVGGGEIATRKVQGLLDAGALVVVVSPGLSVPLAALAARGAIHYQPRPFREDDVAGCALVIGATNQHAVNRAVCEAARRRHIWVNVVDTPDQCDFIAPAVVRRGALQIAISTGGLSPTLAKRIRMHLERSFGDEYAELLEKLGRERQFVRELIEDPELRKAYYERLVDVLLRDLTGVEAQQEPGVSSDPLPRPHASTEVIHEGDDDERDQQKSGELLVMKETDGDVDVAADAPRPDHTDNRRSANIHFPAIQSVGQQLR